jgi:hypothetical protein
VDLGASLFYGRGPKISIKLSFSFAHVRSESICELLHPCEDTLRLKDKVQYIPHPRELISALASVLFPTLASAFFPFSSSYDPSMPSPPPPPLLPFPQPVVLETNASLLTVDLEADASLLIVDLEANA